MIENARKSSGDLGTGGSENPGFWRGPRSRSRSRDPEDPRTGEEREGEGREEGRRRRERDPGTRGSGGPGDPGTRGPGDPGDPRIRGAPLLTFPVYIDYRR